MLHIRADPTASQTLRQSTVVLEAMTKALCSAQHDLLEYKQSVMLDTAQYGLKASRKNATKSELPSRQLLNVYTCAEPKSLLCAE